MFLERRNAIKIKIIIIIIISVSLSRLRLLYFRCRCQNSIAETNKKKEILENRRR